MGGRPTFYGARKRPGVDSPRARADAIWFLTNCSRLGEVTAAELSDRYRLKSETAAGMLEQERARRG